MKDPAVSELKLAKVKLEKDINTLLADFKYMNGVTISNIRLETYSANSVCGALPTRYSTVNVEIIL